MRSLLEQVPKIALRDVGIPPLTVYKGPLITSLDLYDLMMPKIKLNEWHPFFLCNSLFSPNPRQP